MSPSPLHPPRPTPRARTRRRVAALASGALVAGLVVTTPGPVAAAPDPGSRPAPSFDLQAHRGGIAQTVESTLPGFARALRLGVSTLELDVQVTEDGRAVVTHDRVVNGTKCTDTAPVTPDDREFPYVGDYVKDLTYAQVRTLDCGSSTLPQFPRQVAEPGARMPLLSQVYDLVDAYDADDVMLNVETKVEAAAPQETAPRRQFVRVVAEETRAAGMLDQVTVQSFDWGSLMLMGEVEPRLPLVALTNRDFLETGRPGASPWLGGLDVDDFGGDPVAAVASFGADAFSPVQGFPQEGAIGDPGFTPYVTRAMVADAHAAGLAIVPWTVDDRATMRHFVRLGVDGMITDDPTTLRDVLGEEGYALPTAYQDPDAGDVVPVVQAHAHNDYEHERPLLDALDEGFGSVEADVWLVGGRLLVGHERADLRPARTLERLYLDPLDDRVEAYGGSVYGGATDSDGRPEQPLQLLVDIKTAGPRTYRAISRALASHPGLFTQFAPTYAPGPVEAVVSGNRPLDLMVDQTRRLAGYDGRLADLDEAYDPTFMPLVSDNWTSAFTWTGQGPMPADELARLQQIVRRAHAEGYRLRFWETPDARGAARTRLWSVLDDNGVDHLNTDDLTGLADFLVTRG